MTCYLEKNKSGDLMREANLSEIERGRSEASHTVLRNVDVTPYLSPPQIRRSLFVMHSTYWEISKRSWCWT